MSMGCSSCHQASKDGTSIGLAATGDALCFMCHPDKKDLLKKKYVHPAFREMVCTACHDPHGSANQKLLKKPVPDLCLTCHPDKAVDKKAASVHPPFEAGMCVTCHNPHASDAPYMIQKPPKGFRVKKPIRFIDGKINGLCFSCHNRVDFARHPFGWGGGHPLSDEPDPSRPGRKMSCVSCHNPHQSKYQDLFYNTSNQSQMCVYCHSKMKGKNAGQFFIR